jgi:hypothetical protein
MNSSFSSIVITHGAIAEAQCGNPNRTELRAQRCRESACLLHLSGIVRPSSICQCNASIYKNYRVGYRKRLSRETRACESDTYCPSTKVALTEKPITSAMLSRKIFSTPCPVFRVSMNQPNDKMQVRTK